MKLGARKRALLPRLFQPPEYPAADNQSCQHSPDRAGLLAREERVRCVLQHDYDKSNDDQRDQEL